MADFDPTTPSIARVYDYLLNGKDNFAVDRAVADKLLAVAPTSALVMRENRQFLARATGWAAGQGISQFIDLGCGMPTTPNTHQSAQAVDREAHVAYVDTDPVVLAHLRALAANGNPSVTVIDGDVREVDVILGAISPRHRPLPAGVPADGGAAALLPGRRGPRAGGRLPARARAGQLRRALGRPGRRRRGVRGFGTYSSNGAATAYNHSVAEFASFFGELKLVPPGVVDAREWPPDGERSAPLPPRPGQSLVGVARVD